MGHDDALDAPALAAVLIRLCDAMASTIEVLTHADQAVGDGDHGLAIQRGFHAAHQAIGARPAGDDVGALLDAFGLALLMSMGGAAGPIYGTLFRAGGKGLRGRSRFDAPALATFLEGGLAGVRERGGASVGDKTLVDALQPAAEAARAAESATLAETFAAAAAAAAAGAERTRAMRATLGRARTLGDRAIDHVDPGALSFATMMDKWSTEIAAAAAS
jgi:phosphoenolpyruvate---glycerone phosphotransferase subunit DhaL